MAERSRRQMKKSLDLQRIMSKERERSQARQIRKILRKPRTERSEDELKILENEPEVVDHIQNVMDKNKFLKERTKELLDEPDVLSEKCTELAKALRDSKFTVVYTGAGISTSAHIPDYRGPDGVWTRLQKGKPIMVQDLSTAEPTFTHMALKQLSSEGLVSHIVSQNCDGLHLRSGLKRNMLSELHGNMYIEVCLKCKPARQYVRLFDVTERTALRRHKTGRFCKKCGIELSDTIVHFGEKGKLQWPMNWKGATKAASKADVILCLGTSLKVLRRYQGLWATNKAANKRPKLYIVNLQWTPKDTQATLKIHGKCDDVMRQVMQQLDIQVPEYQRENDPIFQMATELTLKEVSTTTRLLLLKDTKTIPPNSSNSTSIKNEETDNLVIPPAAIKSEEGDHKADETQPYITLLDIQSANELLKLNDKNLDTEMYLSEEEDSKKTVTSSSGWYGKGCAKKRKCKRYTTTFLKRPKAELCEVKS